ncbi:MAG TPA: CPBP family intramembrane glutamic endopeptidase [Planctomycetota bacterium]|nr:CPBP family intramembrane glutamic endopeptidase [Planctomycetota bacterium]
MTERAPPTPQEGPVAGPPAGPFPAPPPAPAAGRTLVRYAVGFYAVVLIFAVGYAAFSSGLKTLFGERAPEPGQLLAALALGLGIVGLCHVGDRAFPAVRRAGDSFTEILGPYTYGQALLLALASGVGEEVLFRGALWLHLGLVGSSLLFGLVHVLPKRSLLAYPIFAVAVGVILGLLRQGSGSVVPPILTHVTVNALNLVWLEHRRRTRAGAVPS